MIEYYAFVLVISILVACLSVVVLVFLVSVHAGGRIRRRARRRGRASPAFMALVATDVEGLDETSEADSRFDEALASVGDFKLPPPVARELQLMVADAARKVRGDDQRLLLRWLETQGVRQQALKQLRSRRAHRRSRALSAYCASCPPHNFGPIIDMLSDPHREVRTRAASELGSYGVNEAIPALLRAASSSTRPISVLVISMAVLRAFPRSSRELDIAWTSGDPTLIKLASDIAGYVGLIDAADHLRVAAQSEVQQVRDSASAALERLDLTIFDEAPTMTAGVDEHRQGRAPQLRGRHRSLHVSESL